MNSFGIIWITEEMMMWSDGHITLDNEILSWDMLFKVYGNIRFRTYDLAVKFINILTPSERRHNFDLKPKCLTWSCSDFENCPFVLEIVPFGKTVGKTEEELKKGSYWIRKAHNHDHSLKTLEKPSARNQSVSQYHKLEKKLNEDQSRMEKLEDQLKRANAKEYRRRIQEKIHNLRKLIKRTKTELENVCDDQDKTGNDVATNPYSRQIRQGEIRKAYALSCFMGISRSA